MGTKDSGTLFNPQDSATFVPAAPAHHPLTPAETQRAETPTSLLAIIASAVADPRVDVEKMERLLAMHKELAAEQQKVAFAEALSRLQAKLPQIQESGQIIVSGALRSTYAPIEDIDIVIRPLLAEFGFSVSFDSDSSDAKIFKLSCALLHSAGHSETKFLTLPIDASKFRSDVQSVKSTVSYGRRTLLQMHLNLVTRGDDDDGQGGSQPITQEQADTLTALRDEVKADGPRFLKLMGVEKVADILQRDYRKAVNALEAKRGSPNARS